MKKHNIDILKEQDGQAIFELIVFMPFFIYLSTVFFNLGDSINASINQQKATRGYHFHLLKGNSMAPSLQDLEVFKDGGVIEGSMVVTGWKDKSQGESPLGPCFKFASLFGKSSDKECSAEMEVGEKSQYVKVFTVYGICGATYVKETGSDFFVRQTILTSEGNPMEACNRK